MKMMILTLQRFQFLWFKRLWCKKIGLLLPPTKEYKTIIQKLW